MASGKSLSGRPRLARALDELRPGDCLVLAEWDRATRSMWDGLQIVKHVLDAGATIKVLDFPGVKMGPPFKLTEHQCTLAGKGMAAGDSTRQIARDFNVSHNTIARLR
jgi:DNA invertase Pin-like site-specific DNA recombinase